MKQISRLLGLMFLTLGLTASSAGRCPNMTIAFNDAAEARFQLNQLAYRNGNGQVARAVRDLSDILADIRQGMTLRGCDLSGLGRASDFIYEPNDVLHTCNHKEKSRQLMVDAEAHLFIAARLYEGKRFEARQEVLDLMNHIEIMLSTYGCQ